MRKSLLLLGVASMAVGMASLTGCGREQKKDKYVDGKLQVSIRNLYFGEYEGGDAYLEQLEEQFGLSFELSTYDWANWQTQTNGEIQADQMTDVFHANIDSYNYAQLYKYWAEEEMAKPLPDDLSKWPHIKEMIDHLTNVDALKIDGKLYGIPIAQNTTDYSTSFSPFTYIYRRDWAKEWGVYQENDEYTWDQFTALLEKFREELSKKQNCYALADVEWGFPSITNFYKQVPHCFAQDEETGKYVNNYTTDAYTAGLNKSREFVENGWYHPTQNSSADGNMNKEYYSNRIGVFYENLSYSNYSTLRQQLRKTNSSKKDFDVDDATAIMRIKGEDGKYALEGTDNWFSMTFFDFKISDEKQEKLLDFFDWLLSEEGTRFAIYGVEGFDYNMVDGKPQIIEVNWPRGADGIRTGPKNGAKYLRNCVSLGYDTLEYDPVVDEVAIKYLNAWDQQMKLAKENGTLKVLKENEEVRWLTTPKKSLNSGQMRTTALANVMKFVYNKGKDGIKTIADFQKTFGSIWTQVLNEINTTLKK